LGWESTKKHPTGICGDALPLPWEDLSIDFVIEQLQIPYFELCDK
jgi:hypothetical protein